MRRLSTHPRHPEISRHEALTNGGVDRKCQATRETCAEVVGSNASQNGSIQKCTNLWRPRHRHSGASGVLCTDTTRPGRVTHLSNHKAQISFTHVQHHSHIHQTHVTHQKTTRPTYQPRRWTSHNQKLSQVYPQASYLHPTRHRTRCNTFSEEGKRPSNAKPQQTSRPLPRSISTKRPSQCPSPSPSNHADADAETKRNAPALRIRERLSNASLLVKAQNDCAHSRTSLGFTSH